MKMRLTSIRKMRHRRKAAQPPRRKRSETRQGHVFEAAVSPTARGRVKAESMAALWQTRGGEALSVLLLAVMTWLSFHFFGTDAFFVYGSAVEGSLVVPEEDIFRASGLDSVSIFWINPEQAAEAVARLPNIRSAEVSCRLPDQVTIHVVERQAQLVWQWQDQQFWVDEHGVVLQPRGTLPDALIVQDTGATPPRLGGRVDAQAVIAAQQLRDLRPELRAVTYNAYRGLVLVAEDGGPVFLGVGDDMVAKLAVLTALETDLKEQGVQPAYIDLRYTHRPTYRPREEQ